MTCAAPPNSASARAPPRSRPSCSDVHHGAGQRPGDPGHGLDLRGDQPAQVVHVLRLRAHDDVVRAGDVLGLRHADDLADVRGHVGGLADFGLDEGETLYHGCPPSRAPWSGAATARRSWPPPTAAWWPARTSCWRGGTSAATGPAVTTSGVRPRPGA